MIGNRRTADLAARIAIRRFVAGDAPAVEEIAKKSPEASQWSLAAYQELEQQAKYSAWVVEAAGRLCGFLVAIVAAGQAEILNLAVDRDYRRAGLGDALLNRAREEFQRLQVDTVFLEVRESNLAAIRFYEKHGFAKSGERKHYYREPTEGAVLMIKKLTV